MTDIDLSTEQPAPTPNAHLSVQSMVRDDLVTREEIGRQRYGTALQPHNGRDALRDAYEEALDLACYLRQAIAEREPAPVAEHYETSSWTGGGGAGAACACGQKLDGFGTLKAAREHLRHHIETANAAAIPAELDAARQLARHQAVEIGKLHALLEHAEDHCERIHANDLAATVEEAVADLRARLKATSTRGNDRANVLDEVLRTFTEKGYPGRSAVRSSWVNVETLQAWRTVAYGPPEPGQ
jgi:hypothetical protein